MQRQGAISRDSRILDVLILAIVQTPSIPLKNPYNNPLYHSLYEPHLKSLDYSSYALNPKP